VANSYVSLWEPARPRAWGAKPAVRRPLQCNSIKNVAITTLLNALRRLPRKFAIHE
jgi:hypothetical protein